tara:strand:+ start:2722 stop:3462 length:741 start_codon:yes stop_codon:yes gene_type:complete
MKCLILCAGYATRLYPLTINTPKPLLEVNNLPILNHILEKIANINSIDEIFIVTNNKFYLNFVDWKKGVDNSKIKIINDETITNESRLGAIGDIDFVIKKENIEDDLIVIAGDNLFEFNITHLHNLFIEKNSSVVALYDILDKNKAANKLGVVTMDGNKKIINFEEKPDNPKTSIVSTACYILSKKHLKLLDKCIIEKNKPDNLGEFINWLSINSEVYGHVFSGKWFDIGSKEQLQIARDYFNSKK